MFSSFVNCVVLATIYAKENDITKKRNKEMPLLSLFGNELRWMLRDSISYLGNYDQISAKHFGGVFNEKCDANDNGIKKDDLGRNYLNEGGPQIHRGGKLMEILTTTLPHSSDCKVMAKCMSIYFDIFYEKLDDFG